MKFLLTYGIAETDKHQGLMAAAALVACILALCVQP